MGDRALVVFTDGKRFSPVTYLHWSGDAVPGLIERTAKLMESRGPDLEYWAARFIGVCHEHIPGNLSLGIWNLGDGFMVALRDWDIGALDEHSHGDAGVVLVNVNTGSWVAAGGYLVNSETPVTFE